MTIELEQAERDLIAALLRKMEDAKLQSDAAIGAFGQALGIILQRVVRARGDDPKAQYVLNQEGTALVQQPAPSAQEVTHG